MTRISVLILTKNEEKTIGDCLTSVRELAGEIIIIDDFSSDGTIKIIQNSPIENRVKAKVFQRHLNRDFAAQRNFALAQATGEWLFYIDADERLTPELVSSIRIQTANQKSDMSAYAVNRKNFYYGKHEWPYIEKVIRLFKKESLKGWQGKLHESPLITGEVGNLDGFLLHFTHRDLWSMLENTIDWSTIEADLRFKAGHPKITWWRLPRVMLTEFFKYYLGQGGWRAGTAGLIESLYQSFSIFITYVRLWEKQDVNRNL